MSKTLMTLTALSALAVAAPAVAQTDIETPTQLSLRIEAVQTNIQTGVRAGTITRREARALRTQLRDLRQLYQHHAMNGLTRVERQEIRARLRSLNGQVTFAARNDATRWAWADVNFDGWHDRDMNRDGLIDTAWGMGGPYEPVAQQCQRPGGILGVFNSIFGNDSCDLRVGDRVTGALYAVPAPYNYTYRDGNGIYYRSDGDTIYQIDARTHVVTRVFDQN